MSVDRRHGGPYDRGSADRYYGRSFSPHYYAGKTGQSECLSKDRMTDDEIMEYTLGWDEETERKY